MIVLIAFHDATMDAPVVLNLAQVDHIAQNMGMLQFRVKDDAFSYPMTAREFQERLRNKIADNHAMPLIILEL